MSKAATAKRTSRQQRRQAQAQAQARARAAGHDTTARPQPASQPFDAPAERLPGRAAPSPEAAIPQAYIRTGLMKRIFGGKSRTTASTTASTTALATVEQRPSFLRPWARQAYQRDATLNSIRRGFNELSEMMSEIRAGLQENVSKQAELVAELKQLPAIAERNARSIERFEEQFRQNNHELARSNEIAGSNLKLQGDALRHQAESVRALKEQIRGQADQNAQLTKLFNSMGRDTRDHSRDIDELQGRLDRMRESDAVIANNLGSVASAIRHVSEQAAVQGQLLARLTQSIDDRTQRLEEKVIGKKRSFGWLKAA